MTLPRLLMELNFYPPIGSGVDPFPAQIALDYEDYLEANNNRSVLTSRRRAEMKEILHNQCGIILN
jgi:hypothetical protein